MDNKELNRMIAKRFIVNNSVIAIAADDINLLKKKSDFIDGRQELISMDHTKTTLIAMTEKLRDAHTQCKLNRFAIKFFANITDEWNLELFKAIHDFFDSMGDDYEIQWGLSRDKEIQENQLLICMVGGFNK